MLLSARMLNNVNGANSFSEDLQTRFTEGDRPTIYLQLVDKQSSLHRYLPATGASLSVVITNVNNSKTYTKTAINPYPNDTSIWSFQMLSTEEIKGSISLRLVLTEGAVITYGLVRDALLIQPFNASFV